MLDDDLTQLKNTGNKSVDPDDRPYFHARECMKRGDIIGAFEALHVRGRIREMAFDEIDRVLASDYASAHELGLAEEQAGRSYTATVICPKWFDTDRITEAIRTELKRRDILSRNGFLCDRFQPVNEGIHQRTDPSYFEEGLYVRPNTSSERFLEGKLYRVEDVSSDGIVALSNYGCLPLNRPETFEVYRRVPDDVEFCVGDRVKWADFVHRSRPETIGVTYRVTGINDLHVHITAERHVNTAERENLSVERGGGLVVPSGGSLMHAYCQTFDTPAHEVNCVFNHQVWNYIGERLVDLRVGEQFRMALQAARNDCYIYTTKTVAELRDEVVDSFSHPSVVRMSMERQAIERAALLAGQRIALEPAVPRLDKDPLER
jgi:hypothetical protein